MTTSFDEDGELTSYFDSSLVILMIELNGNLEERLSTLKSENSNLLYQESGVYQDQLIHTFHLKNPEDWPIEIMLRDKADLDQEDIEMRDEYGINPDVLLGYMGPRVPELADYLVPVLNFLKEEKISFIVHGMTMKGRIDVITGYNSETKHLGTPFAAALSPIFKGEYHQ